MASANKSENAILIGQDIESRIVFKNAMAHFGTNINTDLFYDTATACRELSKLKQTRSGYIFLNAGNDMDQCLINIAMIKDCPCLQNKTIVVYDTDSILRHTKEIFAMGASAFINKPYDFQRLIKMFREIMFSTNEKTKVAA